MLLSLGIVQIVLGGLAAFFAIAGAASMWFMASHGTAREGLPGWLVLLPMLTYAVPAANLLATGIGTVRFRRWARLATIVSAGVWLSVGGLIVVSFLLALAFAPRGSVGGAEVGLWTAIAAVPMIGLPITLLVLYTRPGVRATFERASR